MKERPQLEKNLSSATRTERHFFISQIQTTLRDRDLIPKKTPLSDHIDSFSNITSKVIMKIYRL